MVSHIFTWFHMFSHGFTYFHMVSHIFTWFHMFSLGFTHFHLISHIFTLVSHVFTYFHMFSRCEKVWKSVRWITSFALFVQIPNTLFYSYNPKKEGVEKEKIL